MANTPHIPGWQPLEAGDAPGAQDQRVAGRWYRPASVRQALQTLVSEWLECLVDIWYSNSFVSDAGGISKRRGNCTRAAEDAEHILREWGWLNDSGAVVSHPPGFQPR